MHGRLTKFLDDKKILYLKQFGFQKFFSTSHTIISLIEKFNFVPKSNFLVFYVVRTFRAVPLVKKGTLGRMFGKKMRKPIDSKD